MTLLVETSPLFPSKQISHGFFGRSGGHSLPPYDSLNCGPGSNDAPISVQKNRELCQAALRAENGLITPYQTHSNIAAIVSASVEQPKADALVTTDENLAIGILTADCMPVLFADLENRIIGAAHAGWRGALDGILENCLALMMETGSQPENIMAVIGPCLFPPHFQVSQDLFDLFTDKYACASQFFKPERTKAKYQLDLRDFAKWRLQENGLKTSNIDMIEHCTLEQPDKFFSYRFTKQNKLPDYGRNLSAISIQNS